MEILIVGTEQNENECRQKFGERFTYRRLHSTEVATSSKPGTIVFDFEAKDVSAYTEKDMVVFLNSVDTTLASLTADKHTSATIFGFCGLPTFLNREILEVTVLDQRMKGVLEKTCAELNTKYKIVEDRVGMITPRIIGMIINEAYFTIEEGVSSRKEIDLAMKLGTNYPFGPFEWCDRIGIENVCGLLKAVHRESNDQRYKICALLESEANSFHSKSQSRKEA